MIHSSHYNGGLPTSSDCEVYIDGRRTVNGIKVSGICNKNCGLGIRCSVIWNGHWLRRHGNNFGLVLYFYFVLWLLGGVYMELQYDISVLYAWAKGIWVDGRIWEEYF